MNSKARLLELLKLLYMQTDEEHPLTTSEIVAYFENRGTTTYRKTVKEDIGLLVNFGIDIVEVKSTQTGYFCATRQFELPELKLLIDAAESSKFITAKKSRELVDKLTAFVSVHQADELKRRLYTAGRIKPENESVYYIVDMLHKAILGRKKIAFRYYDYTPEKKKIFKHDGLFYLFSPYALFWSGDRYYIIGHSDQHGKIAKFRVDRMEIPKIIEQAAEPVPEDFDASEYAVKVFDMFEGSETKVELECENSFIKVIIDRFGEDIETRRSDESHFIAAVEVSVSPAFYSRIFRSCGKIRILSPQTVVEGYQKMLNKARENL